MQDRYFRMAIVTQPSSRSSFSLGPAQKTTTSPALGLVTHLRVNFMNDSLKSGGALASSRCCFTDNFRLATLLLTQYCNFSVDPSARDESESDCTNSRGDQHPR